MSRTAIRRKPPDTEGEGKRSYAWPYVLIFLILLIGVGFAGHSSYLRQKARFVKTEQDKLSAIADLKVRMISRWRDERRADGQVLREDLILVESLRQLITSPRPNSEQRGAIQRWMESSLRSYRHSGDYSGAAIFDPEGTAVLRTDRVPASSLDPGERGLLGTAVHEGQAVLSDLRRNGPGGEAFMEVLIPIPERPTGMPGAAGCVVLYIEPSSYLFPLIQSWPTPSPSSETLLVRREGNSILFLNELRHKKNTALNFSLPLDAGGLPAAMAVAGKEGMVEGADYRGVPVMAALRHIPESSWFLVAKVDVDEVLGPLRRQEMLLFLAYLGLILAAGGGTVAFLRRQQLLNLRRVHGLAVERLALSKHFEYLTKYANDIILLFDNQGRLVEANDRAVDAYGYSREELLRLSLNDLRSHDVPETAGESLRRLREGGGRIFESVHVRKNGMTFPVEVSARLLEIDGEEFYQEIVRDVSDRKRLETTLRWQHAMLRGVLESVPASICSLDTEFCYTSFNRKHVHDMEVLYGANIELGGRFPDYMTVAEDRAGVLEELDRILKGEDIVAERCLGDQALSRVFFDISRSPIRDTDGRVIGVVSLASDITERKRAEEALRQEQDKARIYFEVANVIFVAMGKDGTVSLINPAGCEILGYPEAEILGKNWFDRFLPEKSREPVKNFFKQLISGEIGAIEFYENAVLTRTGEERLIAWHNVLLKDEAGQALGTLSSGEDITLKRRAEEEIRRLKDGLEITVQERTAQLNAANKELETFSYSVSHDLRAPLRRIDGFSKILLDDYGRALDDQGKDYLARVRTGAQHMAQLIDDLLTLSRLSRSELHRARVDLSQLAKALGDSLQAEHPERRVRLSIQQGLVADGDPALIRIMLENLLGNSWKFTSKTTDARVEFGSIEQAGERVFFLRDNGVGFDMAYAGKLFGPFQRLHSSHEFPGTGIGLATVQRIINRHGGRIWAESAPAKGATFFFTLRIIIGRWT